MNLGSAEDFMDTLPSARNSFSNAYGNDSGRRSIERSHSSRVAPILHEIVSRSNSEAAKEISFKEVGDTPSDNSDAMTVRKNSIAGDSSSG